MASRWALYSISLLASCPIFWWADNRPSQDIVAEVVSRVPAQYAVSTPEVARVVAAYATVTEWASGIRPFLEMHLGPPAAPWHPPPAGSAFRGAKVSDAAATELRGLELALEHGFALDGHCSLHAQTNRHALPDSRIERVSILLEPLLPTDRSLSLQVFCYRSGFLGFGAGDVPVTAPLELKLTEAMSGNLEQAITDPAATGIEPAPASVRWTAELKPITADERSGTDGNPQTAQHVAAQPIDSRSLSASEDSVSFDDLDATDHWVVRPVGHYTIVLVLAGQSLAGHIAASVSGTQVPIGGLACSEGVFAAATNDWNGFDLRVVAPSPHERIRYRVIAISGAREPGLELIAWVSGTQLDWVLGEHAPKSLVDPCVRSLLSVLGTRIEAADLKNIYGLDPAARDMLLALDALGGQP